MSGFLHEVGVAVRAGTIMSNGWGTASASVDRLRAAVPDGSVVLHITPGFVESRHVLGLFLDSRARVCSVAKTARFEWDSVGVRREAAALARLVELAPQLRDSVPEVLACVTFAGRDVLLESVLEGEALTHQRVRREPAAAAAVARWISALPVSGYDDGAMIIDELLEPPLARLDAMAPMGDPIRELASATRIAVEPLRGMVLPRPFEHGDVSHPNLLVAEHGGRLSVGIVDWELARERGAPGHDLAQFEAFTAFARASAHGRAAEGRAFQEAFSAGGRGRRAFTAGLADSVPLDAIRPLFVLAWARAALRLFDRLAPVNGSVREAVIGGPGPNEAADGPPSDERLLSLLGQSRNTALWQLSLAF